MKIERLTFLGYIIPCVFWINIFVCGAMVDNYSHSKRLVSELGTIGEKSEHVFMMGLLLCSLLSLIFTIALYKSAKAIGLSKIPILILFAFTFSSAGAALFPLPLKLHEILGFPSVFLILSPLLALVLWRKQLRNISYFALISLLIMSCGFLIYLPHFYPELWGLKQRIFHFGWSLWFCYLAWQFTHLPESKNQLQNLRAL